jgi:phosphoribosylformimino-5-aminoimidazole carboxamide ribotide isomerase
MIILPAIDLKGGRCVRLRQGRFDQETVFDDDPVAVAKRFAGVFEAADLPADRRWLHVVDLDGARDGRPVHLEAVRAIVAAVPGTKVELGGGIRTTPAAQAALDAGVWRIITGTQALRDATWLRALTAALPGRVVLGLDAESAHVAVRGWQEVTEETVYEVIEAVAGFPLAAIVYTDIGRDGMMAGANVAATASVVKASPFPVIASGGVTAIQDVRRLREVGCAGVIIGRALYEGKLKLEDALAEAARA